MKLKIWIVVLYNVIGTSVCFAQKVEVIAVKQTSWAAGTDLYAVISAVGMSPAVYEVRSDDYAPGGRVKRHPSQGFTDKISARFAIAPENINEAGKHASVKTTWAVAAGWHVNANGLAYEVNVAEAATGCTQYQGKSGKDTKGTWRLPTQKEAWLITIFRSALEATYDRTGFIYPDATSWTCTERTDNAAYGWNYYDAEYSASVGSINSLYKTGRLSYIRCIRDLPLDK